MKKALKSIYKKFAPNAIIFSRIYKKNSWGGKGGSFFSGTGTHNEHIDGYCKIVAEFIKNNNLKKIVEIGCGDFFVSGKITSNLDNIFPAYEYVGYDVVKELIRVNYSSFGNAKKRFEFKDASKSVIEGGDLLIVRQVLQHLSNNHILKITKHFNKFKYIIITEHQPSDIYKESIQPNLDKLPGSNTRIESLSGIYLEQPPFNCKIEKLLYSFAEKAYNYEANINTYLIAN